MDTKNATMKDFVLYAIQTLAKSGDITWAGVYSKLRMQFYDKYQKPHGFIFSTSYGSDFFIDILNALNGKQWKENGLAGDNFRSLIKMGMDEEIARNLKKTQKIILKEPEITPDDLNEINKLKEGKGN